MHTVDQEQFASILFEATSANQKRDHRLPQHVVHASYASGKGTIRNSKKEIEEELKDGGTCRSRNVVYAAICTKCYLIYVGHTGTELKERFSKHRYDIKKRPENTDLAEHFHTGHEEKDMEVCILESSIFLEE